jgi:hypothetical protein
MYRVDITADLNDEDDTGYVWTFLDEARDPGQIKPGAIIVAGDEDTAAVCEVIDLAQAGDGTIVQGAQLCADGPAVEPCCLQCVGCLK